MSIRLEAWQLGSSSYCEEYGVRLAYAAGAMYKGIASKELVISMANAQLLSFFGTGGLRLSVIEDGIRAIQAQVSDSAPYGMNLICHFDAPEIELSQVELFLNYGIHNVEAAAFMQITPALVWYRLKGLARAPNGQLIIPNRLIAKVSRPEVATVFMQPAPESIVQSLVQAGKLTSEEAQLARYIPMAYDICVEADSGGHTDQGVAYVLMPAMMKLRDELMQQYQYAKTIRVGAAGGIGTPEAASAAFLLGADFIVTGSINQCTVEAGTSEAVKNILQTLNIQDTAYAPAGDMFEMGAKVQVVRKGLFFPARANKLYELYKHYNSLADVDAKTLQQIQEKYFKRGFEQVWQETKDYYLKLKPQVITDAEANPKKKMALLFRWYFIHTTRLAMKGHEDQQVDYQIHCGPALGAFNQWVKGTLLEDWRYRHVSEIAEKLMQDAALLLSQRYQAWMMAANPKAANERLTTMA
jgi:trans-AT polyketide synthase/acyltransferase/oxidoreductase domain-containing protein